MYKETHVQWSCNSTNARGVHDLEENLVLWFFGRDQTFLTHNHTHTTIPNYNKISQQMYNLYKYKYNLTTYL